MSIPGFQDMMLPVLELLADGKELPVNKLPFLLVDKFNQPSTRTNQYL
jgi:hypothetical protein